jgi:hypothetical protein
MHARSALPFVSLLLAIDGDSAGTTAPGDQVSTVLEVTLPVNACYGLEDPELFFALLLGHVVSSGWGSLILYTILPRYARGRKVSVA